MRWIKRCLWLSAWGVWACLGVGLYWQLPREVGPKVCEIPLTGSDKLVGFIKDRHSLLVEPVQFSRPITLKIFNADVGTRLEMSLGDRLPQLPLSTCRTHGVVVARGQGRQMMGIEILDLETGRWTRVTNKMALSPILHPTRTWIAFRETSGPVEERRPLAVVDWTTGEEVFSLMPSREIASVGVAFFLADGQRIAIEVVRQQKKSSAADAPTKLELWNLRTRSLDRVISIQDFRSRLRVGGAGRFVRMRQRKGAEREVAVYDVDAGQELLAVESEYDPSVTIGSEHFHLSRSGRSLLGGRPLEVWDVDAGTKRWSTTPERTILRGFEELDAFSVHESWDQPWTKGRLQRWSTVAVHDFDTGLLRYRCWEGDAALFEIRSDDGRLGLTVSDKNLVVVHILPYRANWLVIALCQAILALPLVLLWLILWSRRRRLRGDILTDAARTPSMC